jgi:hypothetical protein
MNLLQLNQQKMASNSSMPPKLQADTLGEAVARRVEAAEKKGRRSGFVRAAAGKRTEDPNRGNS